MFKVKDEINQNNLRAVKTPLSYSSTGWVSTSYFSPGSCKNFIAARGLAVNTCFVDDGVGYKYQLVSSKTAVLMLSTLFTYKTLWF